MDFYFPPLVFSHRHTCFDLLSIRQAAEDRSQHKNRAAALARLRTLLGLKGMHLLYFESLLTSCLNLIIIDCTVSVTRLLDKNFHLD